MTAFRGQAGRAKMTSFRGQAGWANMTSFRGSQVGEKAYRCKHATQPKK